MQLFLEKYGLTLLPIVLGLAGVYLLLPKVRRSKPVIGALVCAAALIAAGVLLVRADMVLPETILFYAFSAIAIVGGVMLICQSNPVHAALSFAFVVLSTSGLFLLNGAPFLMAATIIVYAGAIIVTFLFVIMLAHQHGRADADQRTREPFLSTVAGFLLLAAIVCVLRNTYTIPELDKAIPQARRAAKASSREEIEKITGNPLEFVKMFEKVLPSEKLPLSPRNGYEKDLLEFHDAVKNVQLTWPNSRIKIEKVNAAFARLASAAERFRTRKGNFSPTGDLPVSQLSGQPANADLHDTGKLPARNVSAIGTALFTDYLLAIEIAGFLLLVASIGALVIAGRRTGELR